MLIARQTGVGRLVAHRRRAARAGSTRLDGESGGLHLANFVLGGLTDGGDTGVEESACHGLSNRPKRMPHSDRCAKPLLPYILSRSILGVRKRSIVRRSRHAVGYDLQGAAWIARVAAYVASGFPCAKNTRDGKMPCGPSNNVMSRDLQVTRRRCLGRVENGYADPPST